MAIIGAQKIHKNFGKHEVLRGASLEIERGEVVAIIGPSGSGKTTLLRCINMLERPSGGRLEVDGRVLVRTDENGVVHCASDKEIKAARIEIGMVFQHFNLFPHMRVLDNVAAAPRIVRSCPRHEAEERARALLARVGLEEKSMDYPLQLSGGQRQRVAIARALAMEPRLMLFDEVTSAVDPEMVGEILTVMRDLARDGMTMLVVTHEMAFAAECADRVLFVDQGVVIEQGPAAQVLNQPQHHRTKSFLQAVLGKGPMNLDPVTPLQADPVAIDAGGAPLTLDEETEGISDGTMG